jgi:hypothetical protein
MSNNGVNVPTQKEIETIISPTMKKLFKIKKHLLNLVFVLFITLLSHSQIKIKDRFFLKYKVIYKSSEDNFETREVVFLLDTLSSVDKINVWINKFSSHESIFKEPELIKYKKLYYNIQSIYSYKYVSNNKSIDFSRFMYYDVIEGNISKNKIFEYEKHIIEKRNDFGYYRDGIYKIEIKATLFIATVSYIDYTPKSTNNGFNKLILDNISGLILFKNEKLLDENVGLIITLY